MATREADGHDLHARRPGDRRRVDQGVHLAARRAVPARAATWRRCAARCRRTQIAAAHRRAAAAAAAARAGAEGVGADGEDRRRGSTTATDFLYLGRGINYPIALEGALKLKEISYIHAEGYPAGEMKHGPIALIDEQMPVVAIAPHDHVFEKMIGNMQEVKARGGSVIALTTQRRHDAWRRCSIRRSDVVARDAARRRRC